MAEYSRFFNSTTSDKRLYNADDFAGFMRTFYSTGIVCGGDKLKVTAATDTISVNVSSGYAIIEGYWYHNTDTVNLPVEAASSTYSRRDRVVLRLDLTAQARYIKLMVLTGTPSADPQPPALTRNENIYDLSLAQLYIPANAVTVSTVTDERYNGEYCGLTQGLYSVDLSEFEEQLDTLLDDINSQAQIAINAIISMADATLLEKIRGIDGSESGIDADLLDGQHGAYYLDYTNLTNKPTLETLGGQRKILVGTQPPDEIESQPGDIYIQYTA